MYQKTRQLCIVIHESQFSLIISISLYPTRFLSLLSPYISLPPSLNYIKHFFFLSLSFSLDHSPCVRSLSALTLLFLAATFFPSICIFVEFYEELYKSRRASADQDSRDDRTMTSSIDAPSILQSEVEASIKRLKRNKAPGEDNITGGILQDGGDAMIQILTDLFNTCLHHQLVPKAWKNALVVLIHKKGNTSDIKNYRPISLLPIMYKVFSNILLQRMIRTLDFHQPREQAGFRAGYSTIDHLQVVNQLQEKANEYNMPLCFAFVDYEKAFDSIEFEPLFEGLKNEGVDEAYVNILRNLYSEATSVLRLHKDSEKFKLGRGARQGDNISPKLFTSCLQHAIINKIN